MYHNQPTEEGVRLAIDSLKELGYFGMSLGGQYNMRGGKEAGLPGAHAYQRQYSLGPDLYAQYLTVPHKDFMYGTLTSSYNVSAEFNNGPLGAYTMAKNAMMPLMHHPLVDSIPEIKAINLLYYSLIAQEQADLSGPFTYLEDKQNSENPTEYNDLKTIYYSIVENLDTIVACLKNYETRPDWYKTKIEDVLVEFHQTSYGINIGDFGVSSYIKLANSLKLRMAMRIVKVEPETAKRWAEEAVASGVVESVDDQQGIFPSISGFKHPLIDIANWGDTRLSASFESLLMSLDHPYTKYLFLKNSADITDSKGNVIIPANERLVGVREGTLVGNGQLYAVNPLQACSTFDANVMGFGGNPPCYFLKWAEVDFLRAEGALRGWNMNGTAQEFYERGVRNAYIEDPMYIVTSPYMQYIEEYMQREAPVEDYEYIDPTTGERLKSVTAIGVKWNEADDPETKLEKIITQKYIALFPLSTEAWAELRRTGYPKLFPVLNTDDGDGSLKKGDIIRRIPWVPTDPQAIDLVNNSAIPMLGGEDEQATRLWWDVPTDDNGL